MRFHNIHHQPMDLTKDVRTLMNAFINNCTLRRYVCKYNRYIPLKCLHRAVTIVHHEINYSINSPDLMNTFDIHKINTLAEYYYAKGISFLHHQPWCY